MPKKDKPRSDETKAFWRRLIDRLAPGAEDVKQDRARTSEQIQRETGGGAKQEKRNTESIAQDKLIADMIRKRRAARSNKP